MQYHTAQLVQILEYVITRACTVEEICTKLMKTLTHDTIQYYMKCTSKADGLLASFSGVYSKTENLRKRTKQEEYRKLLTSHHDRPECDSLDGAVYID